MYERFGLFVAGEWRQATNGAKAPVFSPVTEASLGEAPVASVVDTEEALHAAEAGLRSVAGNPGLHAGRRACTRSPTRWFDARARRRE